MTIENSNCMPLSLTVCVYGMLVLLNMDIKEMSVNDNIYDHRVRAKGYNCKLKCLVIKYFVSQLTSSLVDNGCFIKLVCLI